MPESSSQKNSFRNPHVFNSVCSFVISFLIVRNTCTINTIALNSPLGVTESINIFVYSEKVLMVGTCLCGHVELQTEGILVKIMS